MSSDPHRVQAVFLAAVEKSAAERAAHLDRECSGDNELRRRVMNLLKAHDEPGSFLDSPPAALEVTEIQQITERSGTVIGPYTLLEQIGEGGFGVVFLAEQERPVRRRVAIKIIKPGMDTRQIIARFAAERQALAMMEHPNIAKVFDAGSTESGRPYFVMGVVQGVPITDYCDQCNLTTRERLALFITVCQAVQHAHQKGVIHRDIKPTNVLVAMQDGQPSPKIIDFGVAKAINQRLTEHTLTTGFAQMLGTPLYMSPEQAELSPLGVDTRSDIYSLGVLLYELLTGTTPIEKDRLHAAGYDELRRIIREEEPPRPSARISTLAADLATTVSERRRSDARRLLQTVRGELDWIAMKCLEKDRNRRYETANGLARDIERYLADEPVQACPPSAGYRFRKFARRNKLVLATGLAVTVSIALLLVGAVAYAWQQHNLAIARTNLAQDKERARLDAETKLYRALLGRATALRLAREPGYRSEVWKLLHEAAALDIPEKNPNDIRGQVLACLGDPIGLDPVESPAAQPMAPVEVPEPFQQIIQDNPGMLSTVSSDGEWLALGGHLKPVALWDKDGKAVASATPPLSEVVHDLKFTPDGRLLVVGCEEGTVIWSVPNLGLQTFFRGDVVRRIALDPDSRQLATMNLGRRIELWSLASNRPIVSLQAPAGVGKVEFSADGNLLLGMSPHGNKVLVGWFVSRTPEKRNLEGHRGGVPGVAFSPDGRTLASVSKDRTVRIWEVATAALRRVFRGHQAEIEALAFSPDGKLLATGDWDGDIRIWDPQTGQGLASGQHAGPRPGGIWRLRFDSAGRYLAVGGDSGVSCWEIKKTAHGLELSSFATIHINMVYDLAVHPDGSRLAVLSRGPAGLFLCDLTKGGNPTRIDTFVGAQLDSLHFDITGNRLRFVTAEKAIGTWDIHDGRVAQKTRQTFFFPKLAITADDRWAATLNPSSRVMTIYDLQEDRELLTLPPETNDIWCFRWSPDGTRLAVGFSDGGLAIWNLEEVRARLAEFGIVGPSTVVQERASSRPQHLSEPAFQQMLQANRERERMLKEARQHEKLGLEHYKKGELDQAVAAYSEAIELQSEYAPAWHGRGHAYEKLGEWDKALADFSKSIVLDPKNPQHWQCRGTAHGSQGTWERAIAESGNWQKAAADFAKAATLQGNEPSLWYKQAMAHLAAGDPEGYRRTCEAMLQRFAQTKDHAIAFRVVCTCVPAPAAVAEFQQVIQLGETALEADDTNARVLGAALCRAGKYEEALVYLEKSDTMNLPYQAWDWLFLALTHHGLGHKDDARRFLMKAAAWVDEANQDATKYYGWGQRVEFQVLLREAEELLQQGQQERSKSQTDP